MPPNQHNISNAVQVVISTQGSWIKEKGGTFPYSFQGVFSHHTTYNRYLCCCHTEHLPPTVQYPERNYPQDSCALNPCLYQRLDLWIQTIKLQFLLKLNVYCGLYYHSVTPVNKGLKRKECSQKILSQQLGTSA